MTSTIFHSARSLLFHIVCYAVQKDINYQRDLTYIGAHWKGFDDPHSDIYKYRVALGTRPNLDDTRQFMDVGILTGKHYTKFESLNPLQ